MNEAGKGDQRRPTNEQKFRENFDAIFGKTNEHFNQDSTCAKRSVAEMGDAGKEALPTTRDRVEDGQDRA